MDKEIQTDFFEHALESEIQEKGLEGPRVSKDQIDKIMERLVYRVIHVDGTNATLVGAILNTFPIAFGFSSSVCNEIYDPLIGEKNATQDAMQKARKKLYELEGYHLAKTLGIV